MAQAGLGWAGLGLKPGLQSKKMIIFASLDNSPNDNVFVIMPMFTSSLLTARTWCGVLHICPVSTSFIVRNLPMACAGVL